MARDPLEYFEVGQKLGESYRSPFSRAVSGVLSDFKTQQGEERKLQGEIRLAGGKKRAELQAENEFQPQLPEGFMPESVKRRNVTYKNPLYQEHISKQRSQNILDRAVQTKRMVGAGAQSGALNAAIQAKKASDNSISILFPDGTPNSFRRDLASTKNLLGRVTLSKDAQNLKREYGIALDMFNKQVTGLAFSEQEYKNRVRQFEVDLLSNPEAAYESIKKLGDMSTDYLKIADPSGIFSQQGESNMEEAPMAGDIEQDRQQIQSAIESGEYEPNIIEGMKRDFMDEHGEEP